MLAVVCRAIGKRKIWFSWTTSLRARVAATASSGLERPWSNIGMAVNSISGCSPIHSEKAPDDHKGENTQSIRQSVSQSLGHSFIRPSTHSSVQLPIHPFLLNSSFVQSFNRLSTHPQNHPSIHPPIQPPTHSSTHPFIHPPINPPTHPPTHSSIHP